MKLRNLLPLVLTAFMSSAVMIACKSKPSDPEIKTKVETAIGNPAVTVAVQDAMVTLSGTVNDDAEKTSAETAAKKVEDVKDVTNSIQVAPPPAPVVITDDAQLKEGLAIIEKDFSGVSATVNDGVVTLTGSINRDALPNVMQAVNALHPKSVENKLTIK